MTRSTIARTAAPMLALAPMLAFALVLSAAAPALAEQVYQLTPEQRDAALFAVPSDDTPDAPRDRKIHGEISALVGTGGTRGLSGTAVIPIGETGFVAMSFSDVRSNGFRRYRR